MKKLFAGSFLCLTALTFVIAACDNKGGSTGKSTHEMLVGKWKAHKVMDDLDTSAATVATYDNQNIFVTFRKDGTGGYTSPAGSSSFTWELANGDTYVNITDSETKNLNSLLIMAITEQNFTIKDTAAHPAQRETFIKQ